MLIKKINFLRERTAAFRKKARKLFLFRVWSIGLLVIYSLIVFGAFSLRLLVKKENQLLEGKMANQEQVIKNLQPTETKQTYLVHKTRSLAKVMGEKEKRQQVVEAFLSFVPAGVSITAFHIEENGEINFSASCARFALLNNLLQTLRAQNDFSGLVLKRVQIKEINYGLGEDYHFRILLAFHIQAVEEAEE